MFRLIAFILPLVLAHPESNGDVGILAIGAKEQIMFDLNFNNPLPEKWELANAEIVDEVAKPEPEPEPEPTPKPETTANSTKTDKDEKTRRKREVEPEVVLVKREEASTDKILVAKYNASDPDRIGMLHYNLTLKDNMRFTFSSMVKAVGYNLSVPAYFGSEDAAKPFLEITLMPYEYKEASTSEKMMRQLGLRAGKREKIQIFDFSQYGLNMKANEWIDITYSLDVKLDSASAGNYTLMYRIKGSDNMAKGTMLKSMKLSCIELPKDNEQIRKEYMDSTTTVSTTTISTESTTKETTTKKPGGETQTATIFGSMGTEVFMIILVILLALGFAMLSLKHYKTMQKLREYKVSSPGMPNYDNPMYSGSHTSAERMGR